MNKSILISLLLILIFAGNFIAQSNDQSPSEPEKKVTDAQGFWLGLYTKYRIKKRLFYYGEYHMRRKNFMGQIDKVYLRFGMSYFFTKQLEFTAGIATPINFAPKSDEEVDNPVLEFRFWEQALFVVPVKTAKTYHQLRFEQRWKRNFEKDSPYKLSYRWRYKFSFYLPLNHKHLQQKTIYYAFYDEIFIQTGEGITYNIFEDNRMFNGLGYIANKNWQFQVGFLWNHHHKGSPLSFENKHILRIAVFNYLDFFH